VALLVFGSKPYFATPFSYDVASVAVKIEEAVIGISGRATNISGAIGLALKRFEVSDASSKVLILLSDGENTAGNTSPLAAARLAQELGVRIHTIAMGVADKTSAPDEQGVVDAKTDRAGLPAELYTPLWIFPALGAFSLIGWLLWRGER